MTETVSTETMSAEIVPQVKTYIQKLTPELQKQVLEFYQSLNRELKPKTKLDYTHVFVQLITASKAKPVKINSRGKWLQARAVRAAMIRAGIITEKESVPGLNPKWRRKEGSRKSKIESKLIYPETFERILESAARTHKGEEFKFSCILAYYAGMRQSEILKLQPQRIEEMSSGMFRIRIYEEDTKNEEFHITYLKSRFKPEVEEFKQWGRFSINAGYIKWYFYHITRNVLKIKASFHSLRHSCATINWKNVEGHNRQAMLGHKDYSTTRVYLHITDDEPKGLDDD